MFEIKGGLQLQIQISPTSDYTLEYEFDTLHTGRKFTHEQMRRLVDSWNPNERRASWTIGKCTSAKHRTLNPWQAARLAESGVVKQSTEWSGNGKAWKRATLCRSASFLPQKRTHKANGHFHKEVRNTLRTRFSSRSSCFLFSPLFLPILTISSDYWENHIDYV